MIDIFRDMLESLANAPAAAMRAQYEAAAQWCAGEGLTTLPPQATHWLDQPARDAIKADPDAFAVRITYYRHFRELERGG